MKIDKKIMYIIIGLGFLLIVLGSVFFFVNKEDEKPIIDTEEPQQESPPEDVPKDVEEIYFSEAKKENKDVEVSNFKYSRQERGYLISFDVVNNSNVNYENLVIMFVFYDSNQQYLYDFDFHAGKFKSGESKNFESQSFSVFEEVADYQIYVLR